MSGGQRSQFSFYKAYIEVQPTLFWPIFFPTLASFLVSMTTFDLRAMGQIFLPIYRPQKLKNSKSLEYRHVAYQMKAEDISITKKYV